MKKKPKKVLHLIRDEAMKTQSHNSQIKNRKPYRRISGRCK